MGLGHGNSALYNRFARALRPSAKKPGPFEKLFDGIWTQCSLAFKAHVSLDALYGSFGPKCLHGPKKAFGLEGRRPHLGHKAPRAQKSSLVLPTFGAKDPFGIKKLPYEASLEDPEGPGDGQKSFLGVFLKNLLLEKVAI